MDALVLSVFPGIDLLGRAFEDCGFCVVQAPDKIMGGDIRDFHPVPGRFDGLIGGPPCQDFSKLNRNPSDYGDQMLSEYIRVVKEAKPYWFLFENVLTVPEFSVSGYYQQRFTLDLSWFSDFSRQRVFVFGCRDELLLNPMVGTRPGDVKGTCVTSKDQRSFLACCQIHGLPDDFALPFFSREGKMKALANSVPLALGRYVAGLIAQRLYEKSFPAIAQKVNKRCKCGCGRIVLGKAHYAGASCRKRAERQRKRS